MEAGFVEELKKVEELLREAKREQEGRNGNERRL